MISKTTLSTLANLAVASQAEIQKELNKNPIVKDINMIINVLSAGVGIVVVAVIIFGGIRYIMAGDSPQSVEAAKNTIRNGLIGLAIYIFGFAFLQWLVPGGII